MFAFTPTVSLAGRGEKLGGDPRIGQSTCCRLRQGPFSSGAETLSNAIPDSVEACHIWGLPVESILVMYVDWREKHTCCVYQVSPNRLSCGCHQVAKNWNVG
jgi:hypothetical protein